MAGTGGSAGTVSVGLGLGVGVGDSDAAEALPDGELDSGDVLGADVGAPSLVPEQAARSETADSVTNVRRS